MKLLSMLAPPQGAKKKKKRVGCGPGSGHGKTSCRGHKGQKARSGGSIRPGFEGGQMPLIRRLPKRGFRSFSKEEYTIVNLETLNKLELEGVDRIDPEFLAEKRIIKRADEKVKILAKGNLTKEFHVTVVADAFSESARKKILAAGGKIELRAIS